MVLWSNHMKFALIPCEADNTSDCTWQEAGLVVLLLLDNLMARLSLGQSRLVSCIEIPSGLIMRCWHRSENHVGYYGCSPYQPFPYHQTCVQIHLSIQIDEDENLGAR